MKTPKFSYLQTKDDPAMKSGTISKDLNQFNLIDYNGCIHGG
ncbi:hypothetical protein [Vibrio ponticus]|nr:hypothetical protein [Vibrio ponticus]